MNKRNAWERSTGLRRSTLGFLWKEWCESWNSSTLATSCEELTHWKILWCWEGLGQEKKGTTEDEMAGWYHWLDGCKSEWTPGFGDGQGGLVCCDSWGRKKLDTPGRLNWTMCLCECVFCRQSFYQHHLLVPLFKRPTSFPLLNTKNSQHLTVTKCSRIKLCNCFAK